MAAGILLELHGEILRDVSAASDTHFSGLSSAARHLRKSGFINNTLQKKLSQVDVASAYIRHITVPRARELRDAVRRCLQRTHGNDGKTPMSSLGEKLELLENNIKKFKNEQQASVAKRQDAGLQILSAEIDTIFKRFRGLVSTWPSIHGLSEDEARTQMCRECEKLLEPMHLDDEATEMAKAVIASKCREGIDNLKNFIEMNQAQNTTEEKAPEQRHKRMRLKANSKR